MKSNLVMRLEISLLVQTGLELSGYGIHGLQYIKLVVIHASINTCTAKHVETICMLPHEKFYSELAATGLHLLEAILHTT